MSEFQHRNPSKETRSVSQGTPLYTAALNLLEDADLSGAKAIMRHIRRSLRPQTASPLSAKMKLNLATTHMRLGSEDSGILAILDAFDEIGRLSLHERGELHGECRALVSACSTLQDPIVYRQLLDTAVECALEDPEISISDLSQAVYRYTSLLRL